MGIGHKPFRSTIYYLDPVAIVLAGNKEKGKDKGDDGSATQTRKDWMQACVTPEVQAKRSPMRLAYAAWMQGGAGAKVGGRRRNRAAIMMDSSKGRGSSRGRRAERLYVVEYIRVNSYEYEYSTTSYG